MNNNICCVILGCQNFVYKFLRRFNQRGRDAKIAKIMASW